MTDPDSHDGIDLRPLDLAPDAQRDEEVMRAVMSRIARPASAPAGDLLRLRRMMLAAAAVLVAVAAATVFSTRRQPGSTDVIVNWAQSSHVPTNGELLAAYHGYRP